jgi:4a-hydroxytetrahydrobiopterin dehydratase
MGEWETVDGKLTREYVFSNFKEAIAYVNRVAEVAERLNHHPDIMVYAYKKVRLTLYTHSESRISEKDKELADLIDKIDS